MVDIFYAPREQVSDTESALKKIFSKYYGIANATFTRNEQGKPFLQNGELFFSVSHTKEAFFVAVAPFAVGLDAESQNRSVEFLAIAKKYPFFSPIPPTEKAFLREWTKFESAIKFLGGALASDGKSIRKDDPRFQFSPLEKFGHFLCVCTEEKSTVRFVRF